MSKSSQSGTKDEYWARGVGYGHENRPGWDMDAYLAAKAEKDHKVSGKFLENVLLHNNCSVII